MVTLDSLSLPQRVVLLAVLALDEDGETPAPVNVVTRACQPYTESLPDLGKLNEAEVDRALNRLEAEEFVTVPSMDETTPIGKGRPAFTLAADAEAVHEALSEDESLSEHVGQMELA